LADDVCVVTINNEGRPIIHPGYPQMKLWADSLENLGHKPNGLQKIRNGVKKYALPLNHEFHTEALELMGMYIISKQDIEKIQLQALTGIDKFNMVNSNTYRLNFLKGNGPTEAHFKHIEAVSRQCFVKHLYRPQHGFFIDQLIDLIEYDLKTRCLTQ
jgi:hypothetical protein